MKPYARDRVDQRGVDRRLLLDLRGLDRRREELRQGCLGVLGDDQPLRVGSWLLLALVHNSRSRSIIALHPEIRGPA